MPDDQASVPPKSNSSPWEGRISFLKALFAITATVVVGIGITTVAAYLFDLKFMPKGVSAGDTFFFIVTALSFIFLWLIALFYASYCTLWVGNLLTLLFWLIGAERPQEVLSGDWAKLRHDVLKQKNTNPVLRKARRIVRGMKRVGRKVRLGKITLAPRYSLGIASAMFSLLSFIPLALAFPFVGLDYRDAFVAALAGGWIMVVFATVADQLHRGQRSDAWLTPLRALAMGFVLGTLILFTFGGYAVLRNMMFERLGIRSMNALIEVSNKELASILRASEAIGVPLLDCRVSKEGKILVHHADVLWTNVGSRSLISFLNGNELPDVDARSAHRARWIVEDGGLDIVDTKPRLASCYAYGANELFLSGTSGLSPYGVTRINALQMLVSSKQIPRSIAFVYGSTTQTNREAVVAQAQSLAQAMKKSFPLASTTIILDANKSRVATLMTPPATEEWHIEMTY